MKAKYPGSCTSCAIRIEPGEEIQVLLGRWTHASCKKDAIAQRTATAGEPVELELVMPVNIPHQYVGRRSYKRRKDGTLVHRSRR